MALKNINLGNFVNDGTGDDLRTAFTKVNENFTELDLRGGQANTASNVGSGVGLYKEKVGVDLRFKSLKPGEGIRIDNSTNEITINSTTGYLELETSPKLGANLDLNGHDIIGSGNIYSNFIGNIHGNVWDIDVRDINNIVNKLEDETFSFDFGPIIPNDIDGNPDSVGFTQWLKENITIDMGSFTNPVITIGNGSGSSGNNGGNNNFPPNAFGYLRNDGFGNLTWGSVVSVPASNLTGSALPTSLITSSLTSVGILNNLTVTNTIHGSITGNAETVTNGVYTTDIGSVTNSMLVGYITNDKLTNNSITVNGTTIALGYSGTVTAAAGTLTGNTLAGNIINSSLTSVGTLTNLAVSNTITGSISGNAGSVTNGVYTIGPQTISGIKTFTSTIVGNISGNAGTVTNGVYTVGAQTISGTKTFNDIIAGSISGNAGTVTNGVYKTDIGTVTNTMLQNSGITINGSFIALGSSVNFAGGGPVDAGTLTGTTLASNVVSSSLTSVGTLTNLTVTNAISGSISGNAGTVTNGVYTTGTYSNPSWITGLAASKLSGTIPGAVLGASSLNIGTTSVALNRSSGNLALTGISSVAFPGSTSGTITLSATNIAGTNAIKLPATTGTLITDADSGTVTNSMLQNNYITINGTPVSLGGSISVTGGPGGPGSIPYRTTISNTTISLAPGASDSVITVTGFKGYALYAIEVNKAAWVTVYSSTANRTADASRGINTDPTPGSGVLAEVITNGAQKVWFSPAVQGYSAESPPNVSIPLKVFNNAAVGSPNTTITVTLTLVQTES